MRSLLAILVFSPSLAAAQVPAWIAERLGA